MDHKSYMPYQTLKKINRYRDNKKKELTFYQISDPRKKS